MNWLTLLKSTRTVDQSGIRTNLPFPVDSIAQLVEQRSVHPDMLVRIPLQSFFLVHLSGVGEFMKHSPHVTQRMIRKLNYYFNSPKMQVRSPNKSAFLIYFSNVQVYHEIFCSCYRQDDFEIKPKHCTSSRAIKRSVLTKISRALKMDQTSILFAVWSGWGSNSVWHSEIVFLRLGLDEP